MTPPQSIKLRLSENPAKEGWVTSRWEASTKTKRELLLPRRGKDWNWLGGRDRLLMYSHQKISNLWMQRTLAEKQEP